MFESFWKLSMRRLDCSLVTIVKLTANQPYLTEQRRLNLHGTRSNENDEALYRCQFVTNFPGCLTHLATAPPPTHLVSRTRMARRPREPGRPTYHGPFRRDDHTSDSPCLTRTPVDEQVGVRRAYPRSDAHFRKSQGVFQFDSCTHVNQRT